MNQYKGKHLPQIEYFYDGYIYPFIGNADLKTLVQWRLDKKNSGAFFNYNKDARNTYFEHLDCIEQCIKILFSNPTPEFAIEKLTQKQEERIQHELKLKKYRQRLLDNVPDSKREQLAEIFDSLFKKTDL